MVNYTCESCSFTTTKKSTYSDHLTSKKHLNKINNVTNITCSNISVVSTITEPEFQSDTASVLKIKDLENELKLKELEISNLKTFYESQLKMKDELINVLKQQQQPVIYQPPIIQQPIQQRENITMTIAEQEPRKLSPKQIIDNLNKSRPNAPTIKQFLKTEIYSDKNKYFKVIQFNKQTNNSFKKLDYFNKAQFEAVVPNTHDGIFEFSSLSNLVVNMFCCIIEKTNQNECPLYCNDTHRKVFYVKTEEGWKRMSDEEFDLIIKNIIIEIEGTTNRADVNANILFKYYSNKYYEIYPYGLKDEGTFDEKRSKEKVILCAEITQELKDIICKHLKAELSKLTGDKKVKFKPLINDKPKPIEEDSSIITNEEEEEE